MLHRSSSLFSPPIAEVLSLITLVLRIIFRDLLMPPASPLLIGIVGLILWRRRARLAFAFCTISIVSLWLLSTPLVADAIGRSAEDYPALDPTHLDPTQAQARAIVILGGGFRKNAPEVGEDTPSVTGDLRLIEGARVARATHLPVLISGAPPEAASMRRFMEEDLQIPVTWVENESWTTRQNAEFSARILRPLGIDRIILVTSSPHMTRAAGDFTAAGFTVTAAPADMVTRDDPGLFWILPTVHALARSEGAIYEWAGRLFHRFA
jgi:uncharacterized SAM-binding protein YcdF (DUF218 family)